MKTELMQKIIEKQDEYIKKVDWIIGNWETSNMILTRIRRDIASLKSQLAEAGEEKRGGEPNPVDINPYDTNWKKTIKSH